METVLISWIPPKYLNDSRVQRPYFENLSTADELRTKRADTDPLKQRSWFYFCSGQRTEIPKHNQACPSIFRHYRVTTSPFSPSGQSVSYNLYNIFWLRS